ncbi:MAG: hypothetical protein OEZ06_13570 [Myxococcales bacterium]|nr:hypothetical protein [Myxococcales bacterium]
MVDDIAQWVAQEAQLRLGEPGLLMLTRFGESGPRAADALHYVTGMAGGHYRLSYDADGEARLRRHSQPRPLGQQAAAGQWGLGGMTLAEARGFIAALPRISGRRRHPK